MGVLGIVFGQRRTVIGVKETGLGSELGRLQGVLRQTIGGVAGIVVDATVSEEHRTVADVTDNPIEDGAAVTDHVQLRPAQLTVEGVISDTPLGYAVIGNIQNIVRTAETLFGGSSRSIDAYNDMLALQASRQPFTVYTGLKRYQNMIMQELVVPRTPQNGGAIHFTAIMKQITIISSETTNVPLATDVKDLGAKTKDFGNKVTPPITTDSGISPDSTSVTQDNNDTYLNSTYKRAREWFGSF